MAGLVPNFQFRVTQNTQKRLKNATKKYFSMLKRVEKQTWREVNDYLESAAKANLLSDLSKVQNTKLTREWKERAVAKKGGTYVKRYAGGRRKKVIETKPGRMTNFFVDKMRTNAPIPTTGDNNPVFRALRGLPGGGSEFLWGINLNYFYNEYPKNIWKTPDLIFSVGEGPAPVRLEEINMISVRKTLASELFIKRFRAAYAGTF